MLSLFRRHSSTCKHSNKGHSYRSCGCPISVAGTLRGEKIRKSLDLRNWEAATRIIRDWEIGGKEVVTVSKSVNDLGAIAMHAGLGSRSPH
jgi:hypothetical protein